MGDTVPVHGPRCGPGGGGGGGAHFTCSPATTWS